MNDEEKRQKFQSVMARLSADYLARLADKARELERALIAARSGGSDEYEVVGRLIHRLAGSAGSFGVHDVSEQANALDTRLHDDTNTLADLDSDIVSFIELLDRRSTA